MSSSPTIPNSKGSIVGNPYGGSSFDWDKYAKHRPTYPVEVFDAIIEFHRDGSNEWKSLLDVACGPGNGPTSTLAPRFERVVCYDRNPQQLEVARRVFAGRTGVSFIEGPAENLSQFPNGSMDMVTCFTAMHWFDALRFLSEVARVLKPGGTFAAATYFPNGASGVPEVDEILAELEKHSVDRVFPPEVDVPAGRFYREAFRSHYANIEIPSELFTHETRISCNPQSEDYWKRYSRQDAIDRRNLSGVGFKQTILSLDTLRTRFGSPDNFAALIDTLEHYDPQPEESRRVARQIWDVLGAEGELVLTHPLELILARRV